LKEKTKLDEEERGLAGLAELRRLAKKANRTRKLAQEMLTCPAK
jgi:hypothetical protein